MVSTVTKANNPVKALEYFQNEMAFTTGPIELDREIRQHPKDIVIVDVREAEDYAEGHVPGAINLPHDRWNTFEGLDKNKQNIVYCYSLVCHLAKKAAVHFAREGYPVMELDGGMRSWREHDLPVEK